MSTKRVFKKTSSVPFKKGTKKLKKGFRYAKNGSIVKTAAKKK